MATIEDFILRFKTVGTAGIKQAGDAIGGLKDDVANFAQVGGPLGNTLNGIVTKLGPVGLAAGVAATAFSILGGKALQLAGDLEDIAGATGIATGNVNSFAASLIAAGGKSDDAGQILSKLNQTINEAAAGNETLQKAFQTLGVYVTDANGKLRPTGDILQDLTARFQSGELTAAQYAAAIDTMGKGVSRLQLEKLSAADNPAITEATKNIDKFNDEIDKLSLSIKNSLLLSFGALAKAVNEGGIGAGLAKITEELGYLTAEILNLPTDAIAGFLNFFGADIKNPVGLGTPLKALTDKAKEDRLKFQAEQEKLKKARADADKALLGKPGKPGQLGPAGGGYGATPEADVKAAAEYEKRIANARSDIKKQEQLKSNSERLSAALLFADKQSAIEEKANSDITAINITATADIEKAKTQIFAQERLTRAQKEEEFTLKETELKLKAETDIAKIRQTTTDALQRERERIEDIIRTSKARVQEEEEVNKVLAKRNQFINQNLTATDKEQERAQRLFDIEEERLEILRRIRLIKDLPEADRLQREQEINAVYDQRLEQTKIQNEQDVKNSRDFAKGFEKAYKTYAESARENFETAGRVFNKISQGMEDSLVDFTRTGKLSFRSLIDSIIEELYRAELRKLLSNVFSGGGGGSSGGLFGGLTKLLGFANGGIVPTNGPVIVGERGPELLVGASGNRVIPNNALSSGGSVTYNISAVDARSFKDLVASDPSFIYAVTEQGRKTVPFSRR
jgi:lambda family phage tail tape measure protein